MKGVAVRPSQYIAVILLLLLTTQSVPAKCAFIPFEVTGLVVDGATNAPVAGAQVRIMLNGEAVVFTPDTRTIITKILSDANGRIKAPFFFNTYSGLSLFLTDSCNRRPKELVIMVSKTGYRSARIELAIKGEEETEQGYLIKLQDIRLVPSSGDSKH